MPRSKGDDMPAPEDPDIKTEPENIDKIKEKHLREDQALIEEYCRKYNIPVGDVVKMLENAKERMRLGQARTASERKDLKDRELKINPENIQTIVACQETIRDLGLPPGEVPPSLAGRVKPSPSTQENHDQLALSSQKSKHSKK